MPPWWHTTATQMEEQRWRVRNCLKAFVTCTLRGGAEFAIIPSKEMCVCTTIYYGRLVCPPLMCCSCKIEFHLLSHG